MVMTAVEVTHVGGVEVVLAHVTARTGVDGSRRATSCTGVRWQTVVDDDGGYRVPASQWRCPGGRW
jgi:hypothetical protein